jgi:hypothetical protein
MFSRLFAPLVLSLVAAILLGTAAAAQEVTPVAPMNTSLART